MIRTTFYYTLNNVNYIFAIKHCKRPKQTKVYKKLVKLLDAQKVHSIGYAIGCTKY